MTELRSLIGAQSSTASMSVEERKEAEQRRLQRLRDRENALEGKLNRDGFNCPVCKNKGYTVFVREHPDGYFEHVQKVCQCWKPRRSIENLQKSGLADVLEKFTFDNFKTELDWQKQLLERAKLFRGQRRAHCFFVGGNSGAGKTHICSALAIDYLRHGSEVKYVLWRKEVRKIRERIYDKGDEEYLDYLKNVDVLYIDDLFKTVKRVGEAFQRPPADEGRLAFEIISERLDRDRITIISTENTLDELIEIDEAIGTRIKYESEGFAIAVRRDRKNNYRITSLGEV